jgi:hypothetical protein
LRLNASASAEAASQREATFPFCSNALLLIGGLEWLIIKSI